MKDKARKYAKMFSKAVKKLGRSDYKRLERVFYQRFKAHLNSEMYQKYRKNYPSIGTDKVYFGIAFAQIMLKLGYSTAEAIEAWGTYIMADKFRMVEGIDGMMCRMCESYINDTIRVKMPVKKYHLPIKRAKPSSSVKTNCLQR